MAVTITIDDLRPFAPDISQDKADAMIAGAVARASLVAPCILTADFIDPYAEAAKSVLVGAIIRWNDAGTGLITNETIGPFSTSRASSKELFWPSELNELQTICKGSAVDPSAPLNTALPDWDMPPAPYDPEPPYLGPWGWERRADA